MPGKMGSFRVGILGYFGFCALALFPVFADEARPPVGIYALIYDFSLEGCAEYENSKGPAAQCKKKEARQFQKGELLAVDEFFWDDATKSWGAKFVYLGQDRSIPLKHLERSKLPAEACTSLKNNYEKILSRIHRGCVRPSDCIRVPMQWNSCEPDLVFSKEMAGRYRREDLDQQRRLAQLACNWVEPPCARVPDEVICHNSLCSTVETFYLKNPKGFTLQFIDAKTGGLRMNQRVSVQSGGKQLELKTDGLGRVTIPRSLLAAPVTIEVEGKAALELTRKNQVDVLSIPNGQVRM